jgi:hypothetical protein
VRGIVSVESAFGERVYGFEEVARALPAIGEKNVKLEVRLGAAHGEARHFHPGVLGEHEQRLGALEGRGALVVDPQLPIPDLPFAGNPGQSVAAGPARGVDDLEPKSRNAAKGAAQDQRIPPAAASRDRPPRQVARFQEDDHCHLCELGFALVYDQLYGARAKPAHGRALSESPQAALHPAHHLAAEANVPDRAGGKPSHHRDRGDGDEFGHGGGNDSTPVARGWKRALREFLYGLAGYEIAQQALEIRATIERLFMLGLFGDMLGVPILPPYYGLRLLPWVVPQIETWKRSVLRERELGSDHEHHLHGV